MMLTAHQTRTANSLLTSLPCRQTYFSRVVRSHLRGAQPGAFCQPHLVQQHAAPVAFHQCKQRTVGVASQGTFEYVPVGGDARIKVIGVGGGGNNALNRMIASGLQVRNEVKFFMAFETSADSHMSGISLQGVEFWAVNTDAQALANHTASNKMQIGTALTRGLGCGGNPSLGQQAAMESEEELKKMVQVRLWGFVNMLSRAHQMHAWGGIPLSDWYLSGKQEPTKIMPFAISTGC